MKFTGVCLTTNQVTILRNFYAEVLGVRATGDEYHAEFNTEGAGIAIFSTSGMEQMAPGSTRDAGNGGVTLMIEVDDVDAEYERLKALNVEFVMLPTTHPWNARSFWFKDPDGNIVDFFAKIDS